MKKEQKWMVKQIAAIVAQPDYLHDDLIAKLRTKVAKKWDRKMTLTTIRKMVKAAKEKNLVEGQIEKIEAEGLHVVYLDDPNYVMTTEKQVLGQLIADRLLAFNYGGVAVTIQNGTSALGRVTVRDDSGNVVLDDGGKPVTKPAVYALPKPLGTGIMRDLLHRVGSFGRVVDGQYKACYAPDPLVGTLRETISETLPPMTGIANYPVWTADGMLTGKGYHRATGLWVDADEIEIETMTPEDAYAYLRDEVFCDFAFASERDLVVTIAFGLTLLTAKAGMIGEDGPPQFIFTANRHNSGKTLLMSAVAEIITGQMCPMSSLPDDRNELGKVLDTAVFENVPLVAFDNIPRGWEIGNAKLDEFVTAATHKARILGISNP